MSNHFLAPAKQSNYTSDPFFVIAPPAHTRHFHSCRLWHHCDHSSDGPGSRSLKQEASFGPCVMSVLSFNLTCWIKNPPQLSKRVQANPVFHKVPSSELPGVLVKNEELWGLRPRPAELASLESKEGVFLESASGILPLNNSSKVAKLDFDCDQAQYLHVQGAHLQMMWTIRD